MNLEVSFRTVLIGLLFGLGFNISGAVISFIVSILSRAH
jgi:hypothetical protein